MTDARPPSRQPARGGLGAGWKSAILAASLGAVVLGWSALSQTDGRPAGSADVAAPQTIAVQGSGASQMATTDGRLILVPALPQRPVFTQPVTRSRAS